jgi:hypothetical protein
VRTLLATTCGFTIAASGWFGTMALVLGRPGYQALVGLALFFALQSILTIGFISRRLGGRGARIVLAAGAMGVVAAGARAIAGNLTRPHFEGYALIIGAALILQGLVTLWSLSARPSSTLDRTAPIW